MSDIVSESVNKERHFLPEALDLSGTGSVKPYFEHLLKRSLNSADELEKWILDRQELEIFIEQQIRDQQVKYSCNTKDTAAREKLSFLIRDVMPFVEAFNYKLNQKYLECNHLSALPPFYDQYTKLIRNQTSLFTEDNPPLNAEIHAEANKYSELLGSISIKYDGQKLTLQQAFKKIQSTDRNIRRAVFDKITGSKLALADKLDPLFEKLLEKRTQIAKNSGFDNYRDYRFRELNRFDYTPDDCAKFRESIHEEVLPVLEVLHRRRKDTMQVEQLMPYDLDCDPGGQELPVPFENADELVHKTIRTFEQIHPEFGKFIKKLHQIGHIDLDSRDGKAPGGFNMHMPEKGAPFIFMNAAGTIGDMITMIHEGGHAVHSFYKNDLTINAYQHTPPEVSELASMTLELLAMDHYDEFFKHAEDIRKARTQQLERVIKILPWIACIDEFQHTVYQNYNGDQEKHSETWESIHKRYNSGIVSWEGYEAYRKRLWHGQLHIFQIPFYYIEYGIAQLGAIAVWKNYKENPSQALERFIHALKLGYSRPISEIFETAGVKFDFSKAYIREMSEFVLAEMDKNHLHS